MQLFKLIVPYLVDISIHSPLMKESTFYFRLGENTDPSTNHSTVINNLHLLLSRLK